MASRSADHDDLVHASGKVFADLGFSNAGSAEPNSGCLLRSIKCSTHARSEVLRVFRFRLTF